MRCEQRRAGVHARTRAATALRALAVAMVLLAATAGPLAAQVLTSVNVVTPGSGAAVSSGDVVVEIRGLGRADSVEARVVAGGSGAGPVRLAGPEDAAAGQRWRGRLDLTRFPNGPARVEARASFNGSSPTDWTGHEIRVDFPPPHTPVKASPVAPDAVAVSWQPVAIPDVTGYEVQRALGEGGWEGIVTVRAGQHTHTDTGVPPGSHRYRVRALRPGGTGGTKPGPWAETGVALAGGHGGSAGAAGEAEATARAHSGVAVAPRTGGMAARLRAGSETMPLADVDGLAPQVAPRDVAPPEDGLPGTDDLSGLSPEEIAQLRPGLQVSTNRPGDGADAVRLVGLGFAGLLALLARRLADRPRRASLAGAAGGALFFATGDEVWQGARDWSRRPQEG